jgi:hypothetical protein
MWKVMFFTQYPMDVASNVVVSDDVLCFGQFRASAYNVVNRLWVLMTNTAPVVDIIFENVSLIVPSLDDLVLNGAHESFGFTFQIGLFQPLVTRVAVYRSFIHHFGVLSVHGFFLPLVYKLTPLLGLQVFIEVCRWW